MQRSNVRIVPYFTSQAQQQQEDLRTALTGFTDAGNRVLNLQRRNEGDLLVRNLDEIGSSMREVRTLREFQGVDLCEHTQHSDDSRRRQGRRC
jgi:predicted ribosome quality control (RQC) complex YloA/Tae2 family protein